MTTDGSDAACPFNAHEIRDLAGARHVLRDRTFLTTDVAGALTALAEATGIDFDMLIEHCAMNPFFLDGPGHIEIRRRIAGFFGPSRIEAWRPTVDQAVIDGIGALQNIDSPDLVRDFVEPVTIRCSFAALGIAELPLAQALRLVADAQGLIETLPSLRALRRTQAALDELVTHILENPPRPEPGTPVSLHASLIASNTGGNPWTESQIAGLLGVNAAAAMTTSLTLANILADLLRDGATLGPSLRQHRDEGGMEALIRLGTAPQILDRRATVAREIGDRHIRPGETARIRIADVNRAPAALADGEADRRDDENHVGFGAGLHMCPGRAFARLIIQVAVTRLAEAFPALALRDGETIAQRASTQMVTVPRIPCVLTATGGSS